MRNFPFPLPVQGPGFLFFNHSFLMEFIYTGRIRNGLPVTSVIRVLLLRKEVIQPHLPVRLPCYDFTPLTRHTFDGSIPALNKKEPPLLKALPCL